MQPSTYRFLQQQLPEIQRMAAEGMDRCLICAQLHVAVPTLRAFLREIGLELPPARKHPRRRAPGNWNQFKSTEERAAPFTNAELKIRRMGDMSAEELAVIHATVLERLRPLRIPQKRPSQRQG